MINVLFIAFEFPPLNRGGVHRPLAFVQYLSKFDIRPIVITLDPASFEDVYDTYGYDELLGKHIRDRSDIINVKVDKPIKLSAIQNFMAIYFSIHGNETKYWKNNFYTTIEKLVQQENLQAIFATVPPFSVLPLVSKIAKKYQLPLVLDFRDAWSQWRMVPYGSIFHYWKTLEMEKKYLATAEAVIATSQQTLCDFKKLYPAIPETKYHYIPNGYMGNLNNWEPIDSNQETFTIGYVGSFYYSPDARQQMLSPWWKKKRHRIFQYIPNRQDWLYRSPFFFFKALQQFISLYPSLGKKVKVKFVGKKQEWLPSMIKVFALDEHVEIVGELPHRESLLFQQQCDALLITSAKQINGRDYSIAGKTFEYLKMQKPVIAFVCEGAQKDILSEAGTALICNPDDTENAVLKLHDLFTGEIQLMPNLAFLKNLSREALTGQLADIIKKTSKKD